MTSTVTRPLAELVAEFYETTGEYDPTELYARLLTEEPVHRTVYGFLVLSRHADAVALLKSNKALRTAPPLAHEGSPEDRLNKHFLSRKESPDHERLRGLVQHAFSPRAVKAYTGQIRDAVADCVQKAAQTGEFDMAADLARPLPLAILCRVFGIPAEEHDALSEALSHLILAYRPAGAAEGTAELADASAQHVMDRIAELMARRRRAPGDDLLSSMLAAQSSGVEVSDDEIISVVGHLLQAGTQTTRILLTNGLLTLTRHPEQLARLRADRSLIGSAVEECLRFISPARTLAQRVAVDDIELPSGAIGKGERLTVWVGAANRDPAVFADPDTFDITRSPNPHLTFSTGLHFCLGTNLARLEGQVALSSLLDLLTDIEPIESEIVWGMEAPLRPLIASLPVRCR
ncbi:cytochrome P450 [Mycolicibacterium sp.]|uniref:cytochrome P450 n=1 Tax=Mycolicibacterium sp. TaxID=2320850 RepID=UPI003D0C38B4